MQKMILATNEDGSINYVPITKDILEEALTVMHRSFYINENVCVAMGLPGNPEDFLEMDRLVRKVAEDGISVAAIDKASKKVVGVAFNKLYGSDSKDFYLKQLKACRNKCSRKVIQWMYDVENIFDIHEHCKTRTGMEIMLVGSLPEFRKRGIAKKLFVVSLDLAKKMAKGQDVRVQTDAGTQEIERPPEIVSVICTSFVTQKIAQDLGFNTAARIDFNKFVYDGIPLGSKIISTSNLTIEYIRL